MSTAIEAYAGLVERGCLCGGDDVAHCPIHTGASDNRGIAAYFKAGMPNGFPMVAACSICSSEGLLYPNVEIDDPQRSGEFRPTLICPLCSRPAAEAALRLDAETSGYVLNTKSVFGQGVAA